MLKQVSDGEIRAEKHILKYQILHAKQMDFWEIFRRSGPVRNLSGFKVSIYSNYRRTILKELITERAGQDLDNKNSFESKDPISAVSSSI
jgi:hypothetical protein